MCVCGGGGGGGQGRPGGGGLGANTQDRTSLKVDVFTTVASSTMTSFQLTAAGARGAPGGRVR